MTSRGPVTVKQCEESRICLARSIRTSPNPQVTPTMAGEWALEQRHEKIAFLKGIIEWLPASKLT